jgi:hypothetical protein
VMDNAEWKWAWTSEKFNKYQELKINCPDYQPNVRELRECEVCCKVFTKKDWTDHKYFEIHRRNGGRKLMRMEDGKYHCPLPNCQWAGNADHGTTKDHIVYKHK